jgi:hypothetical protein
MLPVIRGREKHKVARKIAGRLHYIGPALTPRPGIFVYHPPRQGPSPASRHRLGQIKAAALRAALRRSHDQPSRRTLVLRALGQCPRGDGLMYENAAGLGCVAASNLSPWSFLQERRKGKRGLRIYPENAAQAAFRGTHEEAIDCISQKPIFYKPPGLKGLSKGPGQDNRS